MKDSNGKIILVFVSLIIGLFAGAYINHHQATKPWRALALGILEKYEVQLKLNEEEKSNSLKRELRQVEFTKEALLGAIDACQQLQAQEKLIKHLTQKVAPKLRFNRHLGINYKKSKFNLGDPVLLLNQLNCRFRYDKNRYIVPTPSVLKDVDHAIFISCDGEKMRVWHLGFEKMLTFKPTKTEIRQGVIIYSP